MGFTVFEKYIINLPTRPLAKDINERGFTIPDYKEFEEVGCWVSDSCKIPGKTNMHILGHDSTLHSSRETY